MVNKVLVLPRHYCCLKKCRKHKSCLYGINIDLYEKNCTTFYPEFLFCPYYHNCTKELAEEIKKWDEKQWILYKSSKL